MDLGVLDKDVGQKLDNLIIGLTWLRSDGAWMEAVYGNFK